VSSTPEQSHPDGDTIAAIATPPGVGGIGIVRLSGPEAFAIGGLLFKGSGSGGKSPSLPASHLLTHGYVVDPADGERIDEVLAVFMRAPHTYTREDVVEFQAHGGPLILRRMLDLTLGAGARGARPGEMTLRAFLNGRLDLAQAEAVMALIGAESEAGRRQALLQLRGELSERVQRARAAAMGALARIEASIDFPEEEVPPPDTDELAELIAEAGTEVARLLEGAERGRIAREGLRVAIVGRPNVGKSSLLNALLGTPRAIVTPISGTTRDTIEERANVGGILVQLVDTAGLTPTADPIESIGVERSRAAACEADLLLLVLDSSLPLQELDMHAAAELRELSPGSDLGASVSGPAVLLVLNKADLPQVVGEPQAQALWPGARVVASSTLSSDGIVAVEQAIVTAALGEEGGRGSERGVVASARHADALRRSALQLAAAEETLAGELPLDFVSIDLRAALEALGEITG
jgi:tRNA modification GTPase